MYVYVYVMLFMNWKCVCVYVCMMNKNIPFYIAILLYIRFYTVSTILSFAENVTKALFFSSRMDKGGR